MRQEARMHFEKNATDDEQDQQDTECACIARDLHGVGLRAGDGVPALHTTPGRALQVERGEHSVACAS